MEPPAAPQCSNNKETAVRRQSVFNTKSILSYPSSYPIICQMFHLGWKGFLLPPRKIRLFMTDQRNDSDIWWRYKKSERRHRTGGGREAELGTEDRRVRAETSSDIICFCNQANGLCSYPADIAPCFSWS